MLIARYNTARSVRLPGTPLQQYTATTHCNSTLQQHTATTHRNHTLQQHAGGQVQHYSNTLQQHTATTYCNNILQQMIMRSFIRLVGFFK